MQPSTAQYESAIRAKEQAIRALEQEVRRLKGELARVEQLRLEEISDREAMVREVRLVHPN